MTSSYYQILASVAVATGALALILTAGTTNGTSLLSLRGNSVSRQLLVWDPKTVTARTDTVPRFHSSARKCSPNEVITPIPEHLFKAQTLPIGEDKHLMNWFGNLCEGKYIEMGALDGEKYSNSYVFNKALGWKGVLIELMQHNYELLVKNRPNEDAVINAGVCDTPKTLHYYAGGMPGAVGGIYEFAPRRHIETWWKGVTLDDPRVKEIQCDRLDNILLENTPGQNYWDFFSLDVEGAELAVLKSINWDQTGFGVIIVEEQGKHNKDAIRELLESHGYTFLSEERVGRNLWFVSQQFEAIYKDIIDWAPEDQQIVQSVKMW